jgi:hypothetical protein
MNAKIIVVVFWVILNVPTLLGQSLPDIARQYGGAASSSISGDSPTIQPSELMKLADLVVRGRIERVRTLLNEDQTNVVTEYTITPVQAFKDGRAAAVSKPGVVSEILVRRNGGVLLTSDGLRLSTSVNIYPEKECFKVGEDVVVFLVYSAAAQRYRLAAGAYSAFRIQNGKVSPMTKRAASQLGVQPVDVSEFVGELARAR